MQEVSSSVAPEKGIYEHRPKVLQEKHELVANLHPCVAVRKCLLMSISKHLPELVSKLGKLCKVQANDAYLKS